MFPIFHSATYFKEEHLAVLACLLLYCAFSSTEVDEFMPEDKKFTTTVKSLWSELEYMYLAYTVIESCMPT